MRALFNGRAKQDYLSDALTLLSGWTREGEQIRRTLVMDDSQHAALTERVKVVADALHLRPEISRRADHTQIRVGHGTTPLTEGEVLLAARIEDAYRAVTAS
ncbi:4a-hydroxytetrahydrobiopterin dehydratase [Micromonospora krabiensis]|uniref:Putative pterin-4-alpha-carbinolamine dehydratase n=1 Tax=Micromonospora krabiensis TaxID=307121 RepID=A0A1C3NAX8_9ACTN|nr:4a-hydroxytetrahydrobiopterin dehydratase [Micromonospora krabiensis]SBV29730.1 Pterin 4 alpha carbinolamine dehydratase [Micromonospora krabiensis]